MDPWLETIGVALVIVLGVFAGRMFSRFRKAYWTLGYFLALVLITILVIPRCNNSLAFVPPFSWFAAERTRFVILSLAITMGLTTPLSRLSNKFEKIAICILMTVIVAWFSVFPFLFPALIKDYLLNLKTRVDSNGICFQSTNYTCGPAAAVTALAQLGFSAEEGQIAISARTSPMVGTMPGCLSAALQNRYGPDGLKCQWCHFDSVAQLKNTDAALAVVRDSFLRDHCVAVLEVSERTITIADPVLGTKSMSYEQFGKIWRFTGIVLKRNPARNI